MKIETRIDKEKNIRYHSVVGDFNPEQALNFMHEINLQDDYLKMNVCWDLSNTDITHIESAGVRLFSNNLIKILNNRKNIKFALIVKSDFNYGMARMVENIIEDEHESIIKICRNYNEACDWINRK